MSWLKTFRLCAAIAAAALLAVGAAQAQPAPAGLGAPVRVGPASTLDADARAEVVAAAAAALRERYVYPDVGEQTASSLEAALAAGEYDGLDAPWAFAIRLTDDLRATAHDKHLRVSAQGPPPPEARPAGAPSAPPRAEGGVVRADRLADDIGYIEVTGFPTSGVAGPPTDRAMAALADTRALIIDVRRNGGGDPQSVTYLVSYFVDAGGAPTHVNDLIWREPGTDAYRTDEFWTEPTPFSYAGKPVYVLTSSFTFSGGEELTYDMQTLGLATIVGETTGGGANPGGSAPLGRGMSMFTPGGRAENPITGTSWEGVGVTPDIAVSADEALKVALEQLGQSPAATDIDALSEARLFTPRMTAQPGSEAALRALLDGIARGELDDERMNERLANAMRARLPQLQSLLAGLGAVEAVRFVEVDPQQGADVYDVTLAEGAMRCVILLDGEGRIAVAAMQPPPTAP